jgi:hypothetical protein
MKSLEQVHLSDELYEKDDFERKKYEIFVFYNTLDFSELCTHKEDMNSIKEDIKNKYKRKKIYSVDVSENYKKIRQYIDQNSFKCNSHLNSCKNDWKNNKYSELQSEFMADLCTIGDTISIKRKKDINTIKAKFIYCKFCTFLLKYFIIERKPAFHSEILNMINFP